MVLKRSNTVCILGLAPTSRDLVLDEMDNVEVWSLNQGHASFPPELMARITRWFQIHPWEEMAQRQKPEFGHLEWLKSNTRIPVYLEEDNPDVPMGVVYPYNDVVNDLGTSYLTSAIAFMLALAIHERFEIIKVFGVELASNTEYADQRPCIEYLIGRAMERGIAIWLPPGCPLLQGPMYAKSVMVSTSHIKRRMEEMINAANYRKDSWRELVGGAKELESLLPQLDGKSLANAQQRVKELRLLERNNDREYHQIIGSVKMCEEFLNTALKGSGHAALDLVQDQQGQVHFAGGDARLYCKPDEDGAPGSVDRFWPDNLVPTDISERAEMIVAAFNQQVRERQRGNTLSDGVSSP